MHKRLKTVIKTNGMRLVLVWAAQVAMFALSGVAAFELRFDFSLPLFYLRDLTWAVAVWIALKSVAFHFANLDRRGLRYVSIADAFRLLCANIAGSAASYILLLLVGPAGIPRSIYLIDLILCTLGTGGPRI